MKKMTSLRLDQEIIEKIKLFAKEDHRSLTGQIEFILLEYLKKKEEISERI